MSSQVPAPAWTRPARRSRTEWAVFTGLVAVAVVVGLLLGQLAAERLRVARYGTLLGTSAIGEWADLSDYGLRARLDEAEVAESFPSEFGAEVAGDAGMLLVRVQLSIEFTIDVAADNYSDLVSCDLALWNAAGERITYPGPYGMAGPSEASCSALPRPYLAGEVRQIQASFQIRPADEHGLILELTSSDIRPQAGGSWPVWRFVLDT